MEVDGVRLARLLVGYQALVDELLKGASVPAVDLEHGIDLDAARWEWEYKVIDSYLEATGGNVSRAARLMRVERTTLLTRIGRRTRKDTP